MKILYPNPAAEYAALRDDAASAWALSHRVEYAAMLADAYPSSLPRIRGEWRRRMDVLVSTAARHAGFPECGAWLVSRGLTDPNREAAA